MLHGKTSDRAQVRVMDKDGNTILDNDGYVPYVDTIGGGDYLTIEVDETGQILNWNKDTFDEIIASAKVDM